MSRRSFATLAVVCALLFTILAVHAPGQAQEQTHYTYVSLWAVSRAQWGDFEKGQEQTRAMLEKLVAEGTLVSWGMGADLVHNEEGYTNADWFIATSQANIVKALQTLRSAPPGSLTSAIKHHDLMLHTIAHGGKTGKANSGVLRVAFWQAKPGRGDDVEAFFKKYIQPDLDADVADGTALSYNFDTETIHTAAPGGYNLAVIYANASGLDKATARLAARSKENPAVGDGFVSMLEMGEHRDALYEVQSYQHK